MTLLLFSELGGGDDEPDDDPDGEAEDDLLGGDDDLIGEEMGFGDDDGSDETELTYRLDEVEKEIDSLGNKVETVRGENEQISDSISTVERNVDKLVDLYEIVTHGVNPFVGDQEIGNAFETAAEQGGFGATDDPADEIDEEISEASAEDFLDDDIDDEEEGDEPVFEENDTFDEDEEELDDEDPFDDPLDNADDVLDEEDDEFGQAEDEDFVTEDENDVDELESDLDLEDEPNTDGELEAAADDDFESDDGENSEPMTGLEDAANGEIGEPPYLVRHPSQNAAELATIEWVNFLVESGGIEGAAQTIAYYETIGWISEPVETYLLSLLSGFGDHSSTPEEDPEPRSVLSTGEHKLSLQYIAWIATPEQTISLFDGQLAASTSE